MFACRAGEKSPISGCPLMKYFTSSELTEDALATLRGYDEYVRARLPAGYRWNIRARDWELLQILRAAPANGLAVLDTGSFNTFLGVWLAQGAASVHVTDLFGACLKSNVLRRLGLWKRRPHEAPFEKWRAAVRRASARIHLRSVDLTRIPFPDETFDFISSVSVIEHIPDYRRAIAEMFRVLRPGGRLLVTTDCSPQGTAYHGGAQTFSPAELDAIFAAYPVTSEASEPDFSERNWCYGQGVPVLTCFVELTKPVGK